MSSTTEFVVALNMKTKELLTAIGEVGEKLPIMKRRDLLTKGFGVMAGGYLMAKGQTAEAGNLPPEIPEWSKVLGRGVTSVPYGQPSPYEKHVIRRTVPWLTADRISSISFTPLHELQGIITPNGLVFERFHSGVPEVNPEDYRLVIHGLVKRPVKLTLKDLMRYPTQSRIHFLECPANGGMEWRGAQMAALQFTHGMVSCCEWSGIPLKVILDDVGVKPSGKWILAEGSDGAGMTRSIPIEKAMDDSMIVFAQNGEMLRPEQGYPVRLMNPGWEGNTSVKWLGRLEIGDKPWFHREETSKYTDLMPTGKARFFTWEMECNSVITSPCPEKPWNESHKKGYIEIQGIAWSGHGKIKRVDISTDGGVNWHMAKIKGLVLSKALTRFSLLYEWDGKPLLLQSRAMDETGYVQPTLKQLRDARGVESIYHKNSIQTWKVYQTGDVENVQLV